MNSLLSILLHPRRTLGYIEHLRFMKDGYEKLYKQLSSECSALTKEVSDLARESVKRDLELAKLEAEVEALKGRKSTTQHLGGGYVA